MKIVFEPGQIMMMQQGMVLMPVLLQQQNYL